MAPKKPDRSETEYLKGLNRKLKKELKALAKQAGRADKESNKRLAALEQEVEADMEDSETVEAIRCSKCKARIVPIDLGNREVLNCSQCKHRESRKK